MKPVRHSDRELVDLLRDRSRAEYAFTELYARYAQRIYAYILRITGDSIQSQDILQEVWVKFHRAAQQELVIANPGGFIVMIARNLCLNWKRDAKMTLPLDELHGLRSEVSNDDDELLGVLNLSLELLSLEHREVIVLKYYQGHTYEEMSMITGESIAALKNRVWRAKEQLRTVLRPYILEHHA